MKNNKKIGVVTWFEGSNYGTVLQALAMQLFLKKSGYDSYLLNFKAQCVSNKKLRINLKNKLSVLIKKIIRLKYKTIMANQEQQMKDIIYNNCKMTNTINNDKDYIKECNGMDILIFGSDQIWNPNWYHPYYYGNYKNINTKMISYASSFGVDSIPIDKVEMLSQAISRFTKVSVREITGKKIMKELTGKECDMVVDPTLLVDKELWDCFCDNDKTPKGEYILCYMLNDNYNHWIAIKELAKKEKLPIYIIPYEGFSYFQSKNIVLGANVGNFLDLIKNAKYIITDSFHGTIFSVIFEKNFILFERHDSNSSNSQNSRLYNLMNVTGLENKIIKYNSKYIDGFSIIDYSKVYNRLNVMIEHSKKYLIDSIENNQI